jgi:uncharacterized glyoxalase superfamily protein PhnB
MKFNKLTPNLEVSDIAETVRFYQSTMGFSLTAAVPDTQDGVDQEIIEGKSYVFAMMMRDGLELMFQRSDSFKHDVEIATDLEIGASVSFYIEIEGIKEFYNELKEKVSVITEMKTTWYGTNEFYMKDINGYILGFGEKAN